LCVSAATCAPIEAAHRGAPACPSCRSAVLRHWWQFSIGSSPLAVLSWQLAVPGGNNAPQTVCGPARAATYMTRARVGTQLRARPLPIVNHACTLWPAQPGSWPAADTLNLAQAPRPPQPVRAGQFGAESIVELETGPLELNFCSELCRDERRRTVSAGSRRTTDCSTLFLANSPVILARLPSASSLELRAGRKLAGSKQLASNSATAQTAQSSKGARQTSHSLGTKRTQRTQDTRRTKLAHKPANGWL